MILDLFCFCFIFWLNVSIGHTGKKKKGLDSNVCTGSPAEDELFRSDSAHLNDEDSSQRHGRSHATRTPPFLYFTPVSAASQLSAFRMLDDDRAAGFESMRQMERQRTGGSVTKIHQGAAEC